MVRGSRNKWELGCFTEHALLLVRSPALLDDVAELLEFALRAEKGAELRHA